MAEIKKIVRSAPLSNFHQAAPEAGGAFRFLAGAMEEGYNFLLPAAKAEMEARGAGIGNDLARQQIGDPTAHISMSGKDGPTAGAVSGEKHAGVSAAAQTAFDALQGSWGRPLRVNSAYRDPAKNAAVGGAKGSQHMHGNAFDVDVADLSEADRVALIKQARASGFRGVGVYNNSLHFDVGGDRAWGPSYHRDSLPAWAAEAVGAPVGGGGTQTTVSSSGGAYTPPTMLREADGTLTARLYSPLAGPLLQISNAAAGVAYQSDIMLKGMTDMLSMSEQFALDPEGYRQASTAYVDDLVKSAPDMFKGDIRAGIEKVVEQRFLGMVEERQNDIRQRAANSSSALADRWSDTLAQAVATGNPDAIASAEAELASVLRARETLPGLSWTPEQSQNRIIKAHEAGAAIAEKARTDRGTKAKADLKLISDAAQSGRTAADETILQNPEVQALFPDQWREAAASVMLRDEMPSFMRMTPAEQQQALAEMKSQPVTADWEMDLYGAAERAAEVNAKAWEADPIKQASAVLPDKPPALPTVEQAMQNPQTVVEALGARVTYGLGLKEKGYVDFTSFFTDEEAVTYGALFGKETPPEVKAMLAGAIVAGAGPNAVQVFKELKSDDPVTLHAGMLMARGGDTVVPTMAMKGQAMLDQGMVQPPTKAKSLNAISPDVAAAISALPNSAKIGGDTLKFATAIFASQVPPNGVDEATEQELMAQSVQLALGQATNKRGEVTGGVQTVGAGPVLLPTGMVGAKLDIALKSAFKADLNFGQQIFPWGSMDVKPDLWVKAGAASGPMLGGKPLQQSHADMAIYTPMGGNMYRLSLKVNGQIVDAATATGAPFIFDAAKLIEVEK